MNVGVSPVTCMQFNPENLTLASGHADRTAKLWDLETFGFVSSTLPDAMPPQQICWIPQNGTDLFTASNDSLKLWNIEKALLKDSIESSWKGVMDISVYGKENALLGLCVNGPTFTLWSTDLKTVNFDENTSREPEEQKVNPAQARTRKKDKPDFNVSFVTCNVNAPTGTDLSELCVTHKISPLGPDPEELKVLQDIDEGHAQLINVMKNRTKNIHSVQKYYENGNMTAALNALNMMKDIPAITDTLNSCLVTYKSDAISLEHCSLIIPLAKKLMESRYESHVRIGIRSCEELINMFGGVITSTLTSSTNIGVDLSREERIKKCQAILECFRQLQESECIPKCVSRKGQVGTMASSLMESLNKLVSLFNR
jgi:WD40 repeat protein